MADGSPIEWLQKPGYKGATWNPTRGCARQGAGCANCWAISMARRQDVPGGAYEGLTTIRNGRVDWLGTARPAPDMLDLPLRWKKPRCVFVESMGDLWHPGIPFEYIAAVFGVMAATPQHVHIILTKQARRMREFFDWLGTDARRARERCAESALGFISGKADRCTSDAIAIAGSTLFDGTARAWPLESVWLLVSAWDQKSFDKYVPDLVACPAAVHGLSAEPLLGPIRMGGYLSKGTTIHMCVDVAGALRNGSFDAFTGDDGRPLTRQQAKAELERLLAAGVQVLPTVGCDNFSDQTGCLGHRHAGLSWVIAGGESGAKARPMHEAWAHSLRDQCKEAGVAFHFKQWGNHAPNATGELVRLRSKKEGGRILSGRTWDEFP